MTRRVLLTARCGWPAYCQLRRERGDEGRSPVLAYPHRPLHDARRSHPGPGGPDENADGGFTLSGWQEPLIDDTDGAQVDEGLQAMDALLLGRRTISPRGGFSLVNPDP
jgi:hypothetical protein